MRQANRRRKLAALALCTANVLISSRALAATKTWVGSNGSWSVGANWSPLTKPGSNDFALLNQGAFTAIYDPSAGSNSIAQLEISSGMTLTNNSAQSLNVTGIGSAVVGRVGAGMYNLNAGTLAVTNLLAIGPNNGSTGTLSTSTNAFVGAGSIVLGGGGAGTVIQNGGSSNVTASTLSLGSGGGTGSYVHNVGTLNATTINISSGTLDNQGGSLIFSRLNLNGGSVIGNSLAVGAGASATVAHNSGTVSVPILSVGPSGGVGTYNFSAGSITITNFGSTLVGDGGAGTFNQTGGTHNTTDVALGNAVGGSGTYLLSGGELNLSDNVIVGNNATGAGTFMQSGGSENVAFGILVGFVGAGTYSLSSGAVTSSTVQIFGPASNGFTQTGGQLNTGTIITSTPGQYTLTGGTLNLTNSNLTIDGGGLLGPSFSTTSARNLIVSGTTTVGSTSTLVITGGLFATGTIVLNGAPVTFTGGTFRLTAAGSNFVIGSAGPLGATAQLNSGQRIETTGGGSGIVVDGSALLYLAGGSASASGFIQNSGQILLASPASQLSGGLLTNNKLINGVGRIANSLNNSGAGEVRVGSSDSLQFQGTGNVNSGKFTLQGGVLEFTQDLTNNVAGTITGRGTLIAGGGIINNGTIALSVGASDVYATLVNTNGAKTIVTGGSSSTFYNPVTNNLGSEFRVSTASTAVFLSPVLGLSRFTGPGTKDFEAGASGGPLVTISGNTIVGPAATVTTDYFREASVSIDGVAVVVPNGSTASTSVINSLAITGSTSAWTGKIDLNDNALIVDYSGSSPIATIVNQLKSGYANGAWTGKGIASASAASQAAASHKTALGIADNATAGLASFSGQPADATSVLIRYTYAGDANLDRTVDTIDFNLLAANFSKTGKIWYEGDFDYDGSITTIDFNLLVSNFSLVLPAEAMLPGAAPVPEPAVLMWIALNGLAIRRRAKPTPPLSLP